MLSLFVAPAELTVKSSTMVRLPAASTHLALLCSAMNSPRFSWQSLTLYAFPPTVSILLPGTLVPVANLKMSIGAASGFPSCRLFSELVFPASHPCA